jgi:hypothetical protein
MRWIVLQKSKNGLQRFFREKRNQAKIAINMSSSALPKLPVGSSLVAVVPRTIIRSPRPQPGKIVVSDPKRVLQHYLPQTDSCTAAMVASFDLVELRDFSDHGKACGPIK